MNDTQFRDRKATTVTQQADGWRRLAKTGRELIKPGVHFVARWALPVAEKAAGAKYVRERNSKTSQTGTSRNLEATKAAVQTADAYRRVSRQINGADVSRIDGVTVAPTNREVARQTRSLRRLKAAQSLTAQLSQGTPFETAAISTARAMLKAGSIHEALSLGLNLVANDRHRQTGTAILGIVYARTSSHVAAWTQFEQLQDRAVITAAAEEFYTAALDTIGSDAVALVDEARRNGEQADWSSTAALEVAQAAFSINEHDLVHSLVEDQLSSETATPAHVAKELERLLSWLPGGESRGVRSAAAKTRNFGIINYDQPGIRSRNVGDYVQTLASMGHLLGHRGLTYTGDSDLVDLFAELGTRLKSEHTYLSTETELNLIEVQRDGNVYQDIPEDTWFFAFGWLMHDTFGRRFNIPFHPNLRPILISIYVRYPEMLTEEVIDYLKEYGPVGCRDWQSVALLTAMGVPAFFSGCLTTTVDTLFPQPDVDERSGTVRVDWKRDRKSPYKYQTLEEIRDKSLTDNLKLAQTWVGDYAYKYATVLTSRLHANLPARSVGANVEFEPKNKSDMRFGGLYGIDSQAFESIRSGIRTKLKTMLAEIAAGKSDEDIYERWRDITQADVAHARDRIADSKLPELDESSISEILSGLQLPERDDAQLEIVVTTDSSELADIRACAASIDKTITGRFRLWLPSGTSTRAELDELSGELTAGRVEELPHVEIPGIANSNDAVRAILPELFRNHDRIVVIPATSEVRADLQTLKEVDLRSKPLAAKPDVRSSQSSLLAHLRTVAARYRDEHERSLDFIFATHNYVSGDSRPFDPAVMVLEVGVLQDRNIASRMVGVMQAYDLSFDDAILLAIDGQYHSLDAQWNVRIDSEHSEDSSIQNWKGQTHLRQLTVR